MLFTKLDSGLEVSNIVLMGIGEPMDNLDAVLKFLELVNHPDGMNIGMRHISLSTCGIIPGIKRLEEQGKPINLAISLHAVKNELRTALMPVNKGYPFVDVLTAAESYSKASGRQITYEYIC